MSQTADELGDLEQITRETLTQVVGADEQLARVQETIEPAHSPGEYRVDADDIDRHGPRVV